jgi:hypothetical protein
VRVALSPTCRERGVAGLFRVLGLCCPIAGLGPCRKKEKLIWTVLLSKTVLTLSSVAASTADLAFHKHGVVAQGPGRLHCSCCLLLAHGF